MKDERKRKLVYARNLLSILVCLIGLGSLYFSSSIVANTRTLLPESSTGKNDENNHFELFEEVIPEKPVKEEETKKYSTEDEIVFKMDVGEYIKAVPNEDFDVEIQVNQFIDSFRVIVPKGASFSLNNERERVLVENYEDGSSLWLIKIKENSKLLSLRFNLIESGQISVEDEKGEVHSAFLYVETGVVGRNQQKLSEVEARTEVVVNTWANFRSAWNNNNRTVILLASDVPPGTSSLSTRNSSLVIKSQHYNRRVTSNTNQTLSWASTATLTIGEGYIGAGGVILAGFSVSGGTMDILTNSTVESGSVTTFMELRILNTRTRNTSRHGRYSTVRSLTVGTWNADEGTYFSVTTPSNSIQTLNIFTDQYDIEIFRSQLNIRNLSLQSSLMYWEIYATTEIPTAGWESLHATISNSVITSSSDPSFNNDTFKLHNSRRIKGWENDGIRPPPNPEPVREGSVDVFYTSLDGKVLASDTITGEVGMEYTTESRQFDGWELVEEPSNAKGIFTEETITVTYIYKEVRIEATLTVEFINELNQILPEHSIIINGHVGEQINLTNEERVIEKIALLKETGYEIKERPSNELSVELNNAEVTVQYKLQGGLRLSTAPSSLDFGTLVYDATTKRVEDPSVAKPLIVTDTRAGNLDGWTLTASLSKPMRNNDGKELTNALRYVYQGQETILDAHAQTVYLNAEGTAGRFDITNSWGNEEGTDGVKLQIGSSDTVHTGSYVGVITWKVMAGQP